ncbi:MAG: Gfo/Idh/MocA family oxidoreductase, partial [Candidatus Omnitrophota bacterium]
MSARVKIGIIGLGYWGKNLLRNLNELNVLAIACDCDKNIIKARKKEFPGLKYTSSVSEALNNPQIKGVVIATPAATHYEIAKRALEAGKDVFVEKPLALNIKQGKELAALAKARKKILMVGHI